MQIIVIGAGIIGLTTGWALAERGHQVTVLDSASQVAAGASGGNGAQLSYAYVAPLAGPGLLAKIPGLLLNRDGPMRFKFGMDWKQLSWSLRFLGQCRSSAEAQTLAAQLALASLSRDETHRIAADVPLSFGHNRNGKLVLFRDRAAFLSASANASAIRAAGIEQHAISPAECLAIEPALKLRVVDLAGGIHTPSEEVGDAAAFCTGLAAAIQPRNDVNLHLNCRVERLLVKGGVVIGVATNAGDILAELVVLCNGSASPALAHQVGVRLPIYPLKGYSLTVRLNGAALTRSVTDFDRKVVYAPLGAGGDQRIRIAGMADLVGHDLSLDPERLRVLRGHATATLPLVADVDDAPWAGLRPATPDSRPIIGPSGVNGLFLNTGHGALGWTLACGSARLAADLIDGTPPPLSPKPFSLTRF